MPEKSGGNDTHGLALPRPFGGELHTTVNLGEQRMVTADADIFAGVHAGAALAHDDAACGNQFAAETFDAEAFRFRIATVA